VSRIFPIVLIFLATVSQVVIAFASDVTRLAPEPVVIHTQDGIGSEKVLFFKASGVSVTKVIATQASGRVATIPETDIQATIEAETDPTLFGVVLRVKTQQFIEHGVPYKGVLLIFTQAGKQPEQIAFSIQDDDASSIESLQASLDVSVGVWQPARYQILIRNNGKTSITNISVSSSNLTDATTGKRISLEKPNPEWGTAAIEPDGERVVCFSLPRPGKAGTFVGQLYITANHQKTLAIPFTVRSRGPWGKTALPFALFCLVLGVGFSVSNLLDKWFSGGGLARAQAYLALRNSETVLVQRYAALQDWKTHLPNHTPPIGLPRTELWLQQAIQELGDELKSMESLSQDQLTADAQHYAVQVGTISLLWSAVQCAMNRWGTQADQLQPVIAALDRVSLPTSAQDLNRYRADLLAVFPQALAAAPAGVQVQSVSNQWSSEVVQKRIARMAFLYQSVVCTAVFFTAYEAYFAHNLAFGELSDYFIVFLWSIGLTQTGSQILSRIHK
jgi:hypothetical protein